MWVGRPRRGLILGASDAYLIPFSLLRGRSLAFRDVGVVLSGAPHLSMLRGIPFVLIGLHTMFGRYSLDAWQRARTFYGITDRRTAIGSGC